MANPVDDSEKQLLVSAASVRPHARQVRWQELEFTMFCHFGVNTFTDREWGTGEEDPIIFNPADYDPRQWCRVMKKAGIRLIILTAKHHDGFCLWPSRYTNHSVISSSDWRGGQGDVLKDLTTACREFDIRWGFYLSPADIHEAVNPGGRYGNGSRARRQTIPLPSDRQLTDSRTLSFDSVTDYDAYFMSQIFELLTEYGPADVIWFDGAHPSQTKNKQTYNQNAWIELIREISPDTVIDDCGPDVRWCGNEEGRTRDDEWSVYPVHKLPANWIFENTFCSRPDLGSREAIADVEELAWWPAETNTTMTRGWFYHPENGHTTRSVENVLDLWYRSVGNNSVLLLNCAPNRKGLIEPLEARVLEQVGRVIRETFVEILVEGAEVSASAIRTEGAEEAGNFDPANVLDDNPERYWMTDDWEDVAHVELKLPERRTFNRIMLQEAVGLQGQRIESHALDVFVDGGWKEICSGGTVGYKKIHRVADVTTNAMRIRILASRVCPTLQRVALFLEKPFAHDVVIPKKEVLAKSARIPGGTVPAIRGELIRGSVEAIFEQNNAETTVIRGKQSCPPAIELDFGYVLSLYKLTYIPPADTSSGILEAYRISVSSDGAEWTTIIETGNFGNMANNPIAQSVNFEKRPNARYFLFEGLKDVQGRPIMALSGLTVEGGH